ncbi:myelodysplastic syndrome 2 translocation-associated protein [Piliocolobus tephrosceles]|uniref:myelodysplastic syndrome 2 translocation-associated protein n=1 Tax=Piliocolobus tephrosceles TaxID=591936 RepID=UPI000C2AB2C9|nr:myelodysplastic syndrome 2 translocation-associated protein [Piliocolobus tephrosceles]
MEGAYFHWLNNYPYTHTEGASGFKKRLLEPPPQLEPDFPAASAAGAQPVAASARRLQPDPQLIARNRLLGVQTDPVPEIPSSVPHRAVGFIERTETAGEFPRGLIGVLSSQLSLCLLNIHLSRLPTKLQKLSCNILNSSPAVRGGARGKPQLTLERPLRPGCRLHSCSEAEKGGFVRRRKEITLFPPCEDPARRWLSASPGREPSPGICWHLNLGLPSLHNCKK